MTTPYITSNTIVTDPAKKQMILDMQRYNGRVNIISQPDPNVMFRMQERIALKNKATSYYTALSGNDWEDNLLARTYFSAENIQIIQNGLRAGVYKMSKTAGNEIVVPPQNVEQLSVIMRSIYFQYGENLATDIRGQIERLNKIVLDDVVPRVYNESMGYLKYLQDQSSLVVPLANPLHHDRNYKQLELKPWFHPTFVPRVDSQIPGNNTI
jgi:phosphopantetheine adenylyltransferase